MITVTDTHERLHEPCAPILNDDAMVKPTLLLFCVKNKIALDSCIFLLNMCMCTLNT